MKYFALYLMMIASVFGVINGRYDFTDTTPLNAIDGSNTVYVGPNNGDDDVAIQAALDKLATTGGTVILTDGIYYLSSTLTIPGNNITLEMGNGVIMRPLTAHTLTKVDYRSNGTYYTVPLIYATGRTNVHCIGGRMDTDWAETELTVTGVSTLDVTVAEDLTGLVAVNDFVHTLEAGDPAAAFSSSPGTVSAISVDEETGATTLSLSAIGTGLGVGDKLMYGGPLNRTGYTAVSWAIVWFDNCTDSTIENTYIDSGAYYQNHNTGRGYCALFSRCTDCTGIGISGYKGGYECLGVRDGNTNTGFRDCIAKQARRHSCQIAQFGPGGTESINNTSCYFTRNICDGRIIMHGSYATAPESKHQITGNICASVQLTGYVYSPLIMGNTTSFIGQLISGDYPQRDVSIVNNTIVLDDSANTNIAIQLYAEGVTTPPTIYNTLIANNNIRGGRVLVTCANTTTGNFNVSGLTITGNQINNTYVGNHGVDFYLPDNSNLVLSDIIISNNNIGLSTTTPTAVINLPGKDSTINRLTASGNTISSSRFFLNTESADGDFQLNDLIVNNNTMNLAYSVLRFNGTPDVNGAYLLNNIITCAAGYIWSDTTHSVADGWISGNYIKSWTNMFAEDESPTVGYNNCPAGALAAGTEGLMWRERVDTADPDKVYLEQNVAGTWTVVGTTDRTP